MHPYCRHGYTEKQRADLECVECTRAEIATLRATVARLESEKAAMGAAMVPFAMAAQFVPATTEDRRVVWFATITGAIGYGIEAGMLRACTPHALDAAAEVLRATREWAATEKQLSDEGDALDERHAAWGDSTRAIEKLCAAVARLYEAQP